MNIVEILNVGFAGAAFLFAFLAYSLLSTEQRKESPSKSILTAVYFFMAFSLALGALTIVAPFIPNIIEDKPNPYMDYLIQSSMERTPTDPEFIEQQIQALTLSHEQRISELTARRLQLEREISAQAINSDRLPVYEDSIDRIGRYIDEENRDFDSKIRDIRSLQ